MLRGCYIATICGDYSQASTGRSLLNLEDEDEDEWGGTKSTWVCVVMKTTLISVQRDHAVRWALSFRGDSFEHDGDEALAVLLAGTSCVAMT